jgi:branched-chain amino acid transport system ATP-binding protein
MKLENCLLNTREICAGYGKLEVLHNVSLHIEVNEMVAVIGANGAGKTTLLRTLMGLNKCHSGSIFYNATDITNIKAYKRPGLGIALVPEGRQIFPRLTVMENIELGAYSKKMTSVELAREIEKLYTLFPILKERTAQLGGTLSGGEQQMLAIARGLMSQPQLLLLDEPSMGVAPLIVEKIFLALQELRKGGLTILLVEQNAHLALAHANRGYVLELGRLVYEGTGKDLLADEKIQELYLGYSRC